jgi:hypothetical protein
VRRVGPRCRGRSGKPQRGLRARQRNDIRITWFDSHKQPPPLSARTGSIGDRHGLIAESGRIRQEPNMCRNGHACIAEESAPLNKHSLGWNDAAAFVAPASAAHDPSNGRAVRHTHR